MKKFNLEQQEALHFDNEKNLEENLAKIEPSASKYYKYVAKKAAEEAKNNKIYSLFLMRREKNKMGFLAFGLGKHDDLITMESKAEARANFATFIPQILMLLAGFGYDAAIKDNATNNVLSNFKPDGEDGDEGEDNDEPWKNPINF